MKSVSLTVSGHRYEVKLNDNFADFVITDLQEAGVKLDIDNTPEQLLKAYLELAKKATNCQNELEILIDTLDSISI